MKKIVILHCLRSVSNCTGAACLKAFNTKNSCFSRYGEEKMELEAFMACNGCKELQTGGMEGKREKAERILRIRPDAIHIGVCCRTRAEAQGRWCPEICGLAALFQSKGIEIVWGTHS